MWSLTDIHIKNLCSFKELSWQLKQHVATVVFGQNLDNQSQRSNGSGKSALIEAIAMGITGEPLREVKGTDEIIRDDQEEAFISLGFKNTDSSVFKVERILSRKSPQVIRLYRNEEEVAIASVNDANRIILDTIGLTKDDIYSNFILSKRKYTSFLSSSDKVKKELINRFSNGVLVDESIESLRADITPLEKELIDIEKAIAHHQGAVSTLDAQIAHLMTESSNYEARKKEQLEQIAVQIAESRKKIREANEFINILEHRWDEVENVEKSITALEEKDLPFEESISEISKVWLPEILGKLQDYKAMSTEIEKELVRTTQDIEAAEEDIRAKLHVVAVASKKANTIKEEHEEVSATYETQRSAAAVEYQSLQTAIETANSTISEIYAHQQELWLKATELRQVLHGTIRCPQCNHEWSLGSDLSISEIQDLLVSYDAQRDVYAKKIKQERSAVSENEKSLEAIKARMLTAKEKVLDMQGEVHKATVDLENANLNLKSTQDNLRLLNDKLSRHQKSFGLIKKQMFDDLFSAIDHTTSRLNKSIQAHEEAISTLEGSIVSFETTKERIEQHSAQESIIPLQKAKETAQSDLDKAWSQKAVLEERLNALKQQESLFVEFKTYLANSKVEALSVMTNEFLEAIGSDIRIAFSGMTMLKSGKVRDKISISLLRDGIDRGAYGKFSQGERSRCELATILALQKLINTNCEEGKGLDLLVIDEVMDGVDEDGLSNIFETLNKLQVTSMIVSHGAIAEGYQHRLLIKKENGISSI